jgi:hypothetical protein
LGQRHIVIKASLIVGFLSGFSYLCAAIRER